MKSRAPVATLALAALVVGAYGVELAAGVEPFCLEHGFDPGAPTLAGAVGSMLLHAGAGHLLGNLGLLVVVGAIVEREIGWRMPALFIAGGLGGAALHALLAPAGSVLVGASGGLCALLAAGAVARPRAMLAFTVLYVGANVLGLLGVAELFPSGVSVADHVGGFMCGAMFVLLMPVRGRGARDWGLRNGEWAHHQA